MPFSQKGPECRSGQTGISSCAGEPQVWKRSERVAPLCRGERLPQRAKEAHLVDDENQGEEVGATGSLMLLLVVGW